MPSQMAIDSCELFPLHCVLPGWITSYGCAIGLLLLCGLQVLFPPVTQHPLSTNAPAFWLKHATRSPGSSEGMLPVLKGILSLVALSVPGMGIAKRAVLPGTIGLLLADRCLSIIEPGLIMTRNK